jgi:plastocyanin
MLFLSVILLTGHAARADDLAITVRDQHGDPLADAVVEVQQQRYQATPEENAVIDQVDRRFVPDVIAIHPGQSVEFPNSDNVRHHVYSFSEIRQFSTRLYADEPVAPVQFNNTGIATLGCNIHDSMVAYVYVSEWQHIAVSDEQGQLELTALSEIPETLHVWHPWMDDPDGRREVRLQPQARDGGQLTITLNVTPPRREGGFGALTGDGS